MRLPERDQVSVTRGKMKADLAVAMGGRIAEELIFGDEKVTWVPRPTFKWRPIWRKPWSPNMA